MRKSYSKDDKARFVSGIKSVIFEKGGQVNSPNCFPQYMIRTLAGPLRLHIFLNNDCACGIGWVAGRFDFPDRAVVYLGSSMNAYSGKWNHFFSNDLSVDQMILEFEVSLSSVLERSPSLEKRGEAT